VTSGKLQRHGKDRRHRIADRDRFDEDGFMSSSTRIPESVETALASGNPQSVLDETVRSFDCQAGTVHWLDPQSGMLKLAAHRNIPPPIVEIVGTVPIGKGIAGLAAERREPVSLCNLQTDTSGQARPAAKTTGMEGSLAVPILVGGELRGVLGIAKATAHDWSDDEKDVVLGIAAKLGEKRQSTE
jgi:signal transduction protein with GAF and PtsI domain